MCEKKNAGYFGAFKNKEYFRGMTRKALFQYVCAAVLLVAGITLVFFGFFQPPKGEVSRSVLQFFAECLLWAASIFGVTAYVDIKVRKALTKNTDRQ